MEKWLTLAGSTILLFVFLFISPVAYASIVASGDINYYSDRDTIVQIGSTGYGSLTITDGTLESPWYVSLGCSSGSEGEVLITGNTSSWDAYGLQVGYQGDGSITILNGGSLIMRYASSIGYLANGNVTVSGEGSSLTSEGSLTAGATGIGSLVINDGASLTAEDYVYIGQNGQGAVTVEGNGTEWSDDGIYIGRSGTGIFSILDGAVATSGYASIAYNDESIGYVRIDGTGSSWTTSHLYLGRNGGSGSLDVTNGGILSTSGAQIANHYKSNGAIRINGEGSSWSNEGSCWLSNTTLSVADGGIFSTADDTDLLITENTIVSIDVNSYFSVLNNSSEELADINNDGVIHLVAGPEATSGEYSPLLYNSIVSGSDGVIQAIGGVWDEESRTMTVLDAVTKTGIDGAYLNINLSNQQRGLVTNSSTGKSAGVGFVSSNEKIILTITSLTDLDSLESIINPDDNILSAWNFSAENISISKDNPVYLSIEVSSDSNVSDLTIWQLVDGEWTEYDAEVISYDGTYVSFIATNLTSYAVTGQGNSTESYILTVATTGNGSVTSDSAGINCPEDCTESYTASTQITLTAAPENGWTFEEWTGGCTGTQTNCVVTLSEDLQVTATFIEQESDPEYMVLTDDAPETLTSGSDTIVYGSHEANVIFLESGAVARLKNFPGSNTITIQSNSSLFTVSRSGATVTFTGSDGTSLVMPATSTVQTIVFPDKTLELRISSGAVMLGDQTILTESAAIE